MILAAKDNGIKFSLVGFDVHYGERPWFLDELEKGHITYMADYIH